MANSSLALEALLEKRLPEYSCRASDFSYIVEVTEKPILCFGTTRPRSTSPIGKNLAPHQKRVTPENFPHLGPGTYEIVKELVDLTAARSSANEEEEEEETEAEMKAQLVLARRFEENALKMFTPPASRYNLLTTWGNVKESKAPFNTTSDQREFKINKLPGPTTYNLTCMKQCRRPICTYAFGKPKRMKCVETHCVPKLVDVCSKCKKHCEGDYWHIRHKTFLCVPCKFEEVHFNELYTTSQLKKFKLIRTCGYMHYHNNSKTGLTILPKNKVLKKIRLENYLSLYMKYE